jgi:hypothetical protein
MNTGDSASGDGSAGPVLLATFTRVSQAFGRTSAAIRPNRSPTPRASCPGASVLFRRPTRPTWRTTGLPLPPAFGPAVPSQGPGTIALGPPHSQVRRTGVKCASPR